MKRPAEIHPREVLRAWVVRQVGHGLRYVITRRYFSDGRVLQSVETAATAANEHRAGSEIGRFNDLGETRSELVRTGWAVADPPSWLRIGTWLVAGAASLTALVVVWLAPTIGAASGQLGATGELLYLVSYRSSTQLPRIVLVLVALGMLVGGTDLMRLGALVVLVAAVWTGPRPR